jgi:hypothetical protein
MLQKKYTILRTSAEVLEYFQNKDKIGKILPPVYLIKQNS